ncbi:Putative ABC-transporter type IV [Oscillibacter sp. PC13]|uniref:putative ABC transporter permease n=1 Tax=Oscillibacter sp. PC13 TaxID=1855299 RepID=UPI0008E5C868|nr:putative ABC transporter permease [Oscillibacter sp. PC13]SFP20460.1 Putative ABC-transporter type IV [Oscillibacter sp. PC13]
MALLFWQFWTYSFLGYLLEKGFAVVTRSKNQVRKCFLLLPLCPVYGLGVLAVLALPPEWRDGFWRLALWGGLTATAVEYVVHLAYESLFHVHFWDYSAVWGNLRGRVCLPFSVIWGGLLAAVFPAVHNVLTPVLAGIPAGLTYAVLLVFTMDTVLSARILQRTGDTAALRLGASG